MNTLIKIVYTEKASEEQDLFFLRHHIYKTFFRGCKIVKTEVVNKKFIVFVSVRSTENKTSDFLVNNFDRNHNIFRTKIIS